MNDRAVSELVGFILIFGIIMTGATLTVMVGQDQISDINDHQQTRNAERSLELLGRSLNGIDQARSDSTVSTINLNDGSLALTSGTRVEVVVDNRTMSPPAWSWSATNDTGGLTYSYEDTIVRYENGMVLRSDSGSAVARIDPQMRCSDDQAIVSIVTLNASGDRQVGDGRVSIAGYKNETRLLYPRNRSGAGSALNATHVTVDMVNTDHEGIWDGRMIANDWDRDPLSGKYECNVGPGGRVNVRHTVIDISFER